jgi:uncharacterized membrane protein
LQGTLTHENAHLVDNKPFLFAAFMSAALRLISLLLYQTAIQLSPLSTTIPYLSFTPAMLLATAYLMIGEVPSWSGLIGVMIVTFGGYLLAFSSTQTPSKKSDAGDQLATPVSPPAASGAVDESFGGLEMGSNLVLMSQGSVGQGVRGAMVRAAPHLSRPAASRIEQISRMLAITARSYMLATSGQALLASMLGCACNCGADAHARSVTCVCSNHVGGGARIEHTASARMQKDAARSLHQLGDSKGSLIMLLVAFLWSLTSTFDKMGMAASPTLASYLAVQRAIVAAPCALYLLLKDVESFWCGALMPALRSATQRQLQAGVTVHGQPGGVCAY